MNLAIEYLLRTGSIRNFFETPCSLCLDGHPKRLLVIEEVPDAYKVTHFYVEDLSGVYPDRESFDVSPNELFDSSNVILPDCFPLAYQDDPINSKRNTYSDPISETEIDHVARKILNSNKHRRSRQFWLWRCFSEQVFGTNYRRYPKDELEHVYSFEQSCLRRASESKWGIWLDWKDKMLVSGTAAAELIFKESFPEKKSIWTSSFSASSLHDILDRDNWRWATCSD